VKKISKNFQFLFLKYKFLIYELIRWEGHTSILVKKRYLEFKFVEYNIPVKLIKLIKIKNLLFCYFLINNIR
jgi:hypothetical protein